MFPYGRSDRKRSQAIVDDRRRSQGIKLGLVEHLTICILTVSFLNHLFHFANDH